MPTLTLDNLNKNTGGAQAPTQEWQRYTLDSATFGTQTLTLNDIHDLMVAELKQFRTTINQAGVQPQNDASLTLGQGILGWATLALKGLPNTRDQRQWANAWKVKLLPNSTSNSTGEFFHVQADTGYIELSQNTTDPQSVSYVKLYTKAGDTEDSVPKLISLFKDPATFDLPSNTTKKTALRQMATALFLAEVHRNHLTLLVNVAMFDLIKAGVFTLSYFLGTFHPMAQGGPMAQIASGTSGAENGGNNNTRTRTLETTILMYWLKLLEPQVVLNKGNHQIAFNSNQPALSDIRQQLPVFNQPSLVAVNGVNPLKNAIQERLHTALLQSDLTYTS